MERTTIYLDDYIKRCLLELSAEESRKKGRRIGMAVVVRDALVEYLRKRGKAVEDPRSVVDKMLATRGTLGEDFEKRVKKAQAEINKWQIKSV